MSTQALTFSGARARAEAKAEGRNVPRVRVVESCAHLAPGEYLWGVARMTNPNWLSPLRRFLFVLQRQKLGVPAGKHPATRGNLWTFEDAEAECLDEWDYLYREPLGSLLPREGGRPPEDFVRPRWEGHARLREEMRERFAHEAEALRARGVSVRPPPSELAEAATGTARELVGVLERLADSGG